MTPKERRTYVLTRPDRTWCSQCKSPVSLIAPKGACYRLPGFYICWTCKKVFRKHADAEVMETL